MRLCFRPTLFLWMLIFGMRPLLAQIPDQKKGITLTGNSRIYTQVSSREGNYQELPRNFARWELNNTFNFSGIPVTAGFFLTTEGSEMRQNISAFRVGLDARSIARSKLYEKFRFLSWFPTLEAGNCRPAYSAFTLNGVNLRGVNVEFNPGAFYTAFATGRLKRATGQSPPRYQSYDRDVTFARLGVGKRRQSYFALSLLHARDDTASLQPDPHTYYYGPDTLEYDAETFIHGRDSGFLYVLPKENWVAGAELNLSFLKQKLVLNGEMAGSLATANRNAYGFTFEEIPENYRDLLYYNSSSHIGYAWALRSALKLRNTEMTGSFRYVDPGFVSLGTSYLRTDVSQYEGSLVQYLIRKNIRLQLFYKSSRDNLLGWKSQTTLFSNWGVNASLRLPKAPFLTVLYSPFHSSYEGPAGDVLFDAENLTVTSGFQLRFGRSSAFTNALFSLQNGSNTLETGDSSMENLNWMVSETLNLGKSVSLFGSAGYNNLETSTILRKTTTYNGKISFTGSRRFRSYLGMSQTRWKEEMERTRLYFNVLFDMGKLGTLTLQADRNNYANHKEEGKDYEEYIVRLGLAHRW